MRIRKLLSMFTVLTMIFSVAIPLGVAADEQTNPHQSSFSDTRMDHNDTYYGVSTSRYCYLIGTSHMYGYIGTTSPSDFIDLGYNNAISGVKLYGGTDPYLYYSKNGTLYKMTGPNSSATVVATLPSDMGSDVQIQSSKSHGLLVTTGTTAYIYKDGAFSRIAAMPSFPRTSMTSYSDEFYIAAENHILYRYNAASSSWVQVASLTGSDTNLQGYTVACDGAFAYAIGGGTTREEPIMDSHTGAIIGHRTFYDMKRDITQISLKNGSTRKYKSLYYQYYPVVVSYPSISSGNTEYRILKIIGGHGSDTYVSDLSGGKLYNSDCGEYFLYEMGAVKFNSNGGSEVSGQLVELNGTSIQPAEPTKDGYTFAGWYTNSALTTPFNFSTPIAATITLYAKWEEEQITPTISMSKTSFVRGENMVINVGGSLYAKDWLCINQYPTTGGYSNEWCYLNGTQTAPTTVQPDGNVTISTENLAPGTYYLHYCSDNSYSIYPEGTITFTITRDNPTIKIDKSTYTKGEKVNVQFTDAHTAKDWICVNQKAAEAGYSLEWCYLNGTQTAPTTMISNGRVQIDTTNLAPGTYYIYYCQNDVYTYYAKTSFTVVA